MTPNWEVAYFRSVILESLSAAEIAITPDMSAPKFVTSLKFVRLFSARLQAVRAQNQLKMRVEQQVWQRPMSHKRPKLGSSLLQIGDVRVLERCSDRNHAGHVFAAVSEVVVRQAACDKSTELAQNAY